MIYSLFQIKLWGTIQIFVTVKLKFKIKTYFCVREVSNLSFNTLPTGIKYLKFYSIQEVRSNYSDKFRQNPLLKMTGLVCFRLLYTLIINSYVSYSVLKI